ncbi:hypothetical protein BH10PLA2_BH10PLA2_15890 [soil metagenome]
MRGIGKFGPTKEANIDLRFEDIDIRERGILYTCRRMAVRQQFVFVLTPLA